MVDSRQRRGALLTVLAALALAGCGTPSGTPQATRDAVHAAAAKLPPDYTYVLTSTCGERALIGRYRITVLDRDTVTTGQPADRDTNRQVTDYPTIATLLAGVDTAGPDAVIEFSTDAAGLPASLSIDPLPRSVDDEECYTFADIQPLPPEPSPR